VKSQLACTKEELADLKKRKIENPTCYEWDKIKADLAADRERYPAETAVILITDDGVNYEHMMRALDITRGLGYDKTLLGGGPASTGTALPTGN
jgi:hypothetical protein